MALRSLILLHAPNAVELARFALWRDDPGLEPVVNPRWNNPRSGTDFRVKMVVFPALQSHPGAATEQLCRDYLALTDDAARQIGPPQFEEAARALLTVSPRTETAVELMKHRLKAVRGQAILGCLRSGKASWARSALEKGAPHALAYNVLIEDPPIPQPSHVEIPVDLSAYQPASGVTVRRDQTRMLVSWPMMEGERGVLILQLRPDRPLIEELGISKAVNETSTPLLRNVNPVTFVTVGTRDLSKQGWNVFFDNPPLRPHETYPAVLEKKKVRIQSQGRHCTVIIDELSAGPFRGDLRFTVYPGCRLVRAEAVVSTEKDACAILYDAGLTSQKPDWKTVAWMDTRDQLQRIETTSQQSAVPVAARHRTIVAESEDGSVAAFPPPHQFLYPLDFANNYKLVWHGRSFHNAAEAWGFGVRQPPDGDKRYVPWVNAPPRTQQHLSVFYLLSSGKAQQALEQVRRFTHGDRFKRLDGFLTFTSHYHIEHTLEFLRLQDIFFKRPTLFSYLHGWLPVYSCIWGQASRMLEHRGLPSF
jgi:hypothetical protein